MLVMQVKISRQQHQQLVDWAAEAHPTECCGLLLVGASGVELQLVANVAADPSQHFEIDPASLISAEKAERVGESKIVGYFHSHPNGLANPSDTDAASALSDGRIWLIISGEQISAWKKQSDAAFIEVALVIDG